MKIGIISSSVFAVGVGGNQGLPSYGGLEQIAWLCARGLAARGHDVTLIAPEGSTCPGCKLIHAGPPGRWDESQAYQFYWKALPQFDVLIDHSWQKNCYLLKAEGVFKGPILGVMHAPCDTMYRTLPPGVDKPCFVCISRDQAAHFQQIHNRPARHCYNGIDLDVYRPIAVPRNNRFLFLARFSTIKGPDIALEACYRADAGLDLIGDTSITNEPDYFRHCQALAERTSPGWRGPGRQFNIIGSVPRGETVWWYSRAHVMLHPNERFREPFGLAPVEAMACGLPCLMWRHGACRETALPPCNERGFGHPADSWWLVDSMDQLVDKIKQLSRPGAFTELFGDNYRSLARDWASRFSIDAMVARYEELCQEALAGGW